MLAGHDVTVVRTGLSAGLSQTRWVVFVQVSSLHLEILKKCSFTFRRMSSSLMLLLRAVVAMM